MRIAQDLALVIHSVKRPACAGERWAKKKVAEMQKHRHQFVEGASLPRCEGTVA